MMLHWEFTLTAYAMSSAAKVINYNKCVVMWKVGQIVLFDVDVKTVIS